MLMKLKEGVNISGIKPEIILAILIIYNVFEHFNLAPDFEYVITSGLEGKHSPGSLHYVGFAIDVRTRNLSVPDRKWLRERIADALGKQFDVVLHKTHLHIEFQPKS